MNSRKKYKLLKAIELALEDPEKYEAKRKKQEQVLTAIAWIGLFISFLLYFQELRGIYLPVLASLSGILYGISIYLGATAKQWPLLAKHVSIESIRGELGEIA